MTTATASRTITGMHPITKDPITVTLADDEEVVGECPDGMPLVQTRDRRFGSTFGVAYLVPDLPYDDLEAFDPRGVGMH